MGRLSRLLRPHSIAVIGGKPAAEAIIQSRRIGFEGDIWPVHPTLDSVAGEPAFRSIAELPSAPDAAFVAVNRHLTVEIVGELARCGAGGAVCYAAGFAESGREGAVLQARLIDAAGEMPIFGPNCYGFLSYLDGVALWPDQHGGARVERGVAIVTQSGNIGLNLTMQRRGLPLAYLMTLGNQANVGLSATIAALVEDPRVTAIGLHIEGLDDTAAFAEACAAARRRGIGVVALKTGGSTAGAALTVSHTASLAGADAVADAYFRHVGVARVHSVPVLLETLKLLHFQGPMRGRNIASMSCSGGEAALMADAIERHDLRFGALSPADAKAVAASLPPLVTISNPLDYHTFSWGDEAALTGTFTAMLGTGYDISLVVLDLPRSDRADAASWHVSRRALAAAARATGGRAGIVATLPETMTEADATQVVADGLVPLLGIEEALAALSASADVGSYFSRAETPPPNPLPQAGEGFFSLSRETGEGRGGGASAASLSEWDGKQLLAGYRLTIPDGALAFTVAEAAKAATELGFPVVVKAVGRDIAHKSEIGAVRLNLKTSNAVAEAAEALLPLGEALLIERMVPDVVAELIVGVNRDPVFGLHLVIGSGGVLVELLADSTILMIPASRTEIDHALASLRGHRLLTGYRGRPVGDREAIIEAILAIQRFAMATGDRLLELDVNPLMVRPAGSGAVAADVLIRLSDGAPA